MKIVYYSKPWYADCDFPLIREYQKEDHEVYYFIDLVVLKTTLFDIKQQPPKYGILKASEFPELQKYSEYLDLNRVFILNHKLRDRYILQHIWTYICFLFMVIKINPDVFHFTTVLRFRESVLYLLKKRMILTVHDPFLHSGETTKKMRMYRKLAFRIINKYVILNECQKKQFSLAHHIKENNILVNRLGVYDNLCDANITKDKHTSFRVLFFGRISPYKGIDYLIKAIDIAHKENPNIECVIAGKGKFSFDISKCYYKEYFTILNRFIPDEELANLIYNSDVVVCPYIDATQSGVVQQAYGFEKPVIASNVGAMSEYIIDGVTGSIVPAKNADMLAKEILRYSKSPQLLMNIKENIISATTNGFISWKQIAANYLDFYKKI